MPYACIASVNCFPTSADVFKRVQAGSDWSCRAFVIDASAHALSLLVVVGLAACVPRHRVPLLTNAGLGPLVTLILHIGLIPWTNLLGNQSLQLVREASTHAADQTELLLLTALALCFLQVLLRRPSLRP